MFIRKNYRPKLFFILFVFFVLYVIIAVRLYLVQIHQRDFFKILAQQQYVTEIKTQPPRAIIYDKQGVPLVFNKEIFSAFIVPSQLQNREQTKAFLKKNFKHVYKEIKRKTKRHFLWIERHLSDEQLERIKKSGVPDIHLLAETCRFYPFPAMAHVIGFTDIDNIGIAGVELQFNDRIGGTPTTFILEKDARSGYFYFKRNVKKEGSHGNGVQLTINRNLQFLAYEELKQSVEKHEAKSGAVLIMDPDSGHILSMVSYPGFDANQKGISSFEETKNIVVTECFELGSVMKVVTALAALEEGVVTFDEEFDCEGRVGYVDGFRVENWKSLGIIPFWDVISRSSNVGTAKVAKRLGPKLYYHLQRLGFGSCTGIQFPGERSGFVNPPYNWSRYSIIVMSFGYEIMATLLQLGKAFSVIANDGYAVQPVLIINKQERKHFLQKKRNRLYKKTVVDQLKDILTLKGWLSQLYSIKGYNVMGKTGTSRLVKDGQYSKKNHIYTFGGIVEKDNYRRVIITFIKEPKATNLWATQVTVPLFHRVAERMIIYDMLNKS